MPASITRRAAIGSVVSVIAVPAWAQSGPPWRPDAEARIADLQARAGGRLGIAAFDSGTGQALRHRADERFAMCSTFKFLAAAFVLLRVDRREEQLDRRVLYGRQDLVTYSPATERHADADGMKLDAICEAAVTLSDNTAGNLLLASFGGPAGLTGFARSLGDDVTRLDRIETALNEATPGDPRDTTTPSAMLDLMRKILLGDVLSQASRDKLTTWLIGSKTGGKRLRAGLPPTWRVGDKTGNGSHAAANDIAVAWPPGRPPLLVAVYFAESAKSEEEQNAIIVEVGRVIVSAS